MLVGFVATGVALVIGVSWGIIAGYAGGRIDSVMMRIVDILYGLPFIIFIILLMVIFGRNLWLLKCPNYSLVVECLNQGSLKSLQAA